MKCALLHGPPESRFVPLSEPMVNVRSTCEAAAVAGMIDEQEAAAILSAAKLLHYRERTWKTVLAAAVLRSGRLEAIHPLAPRRKRRPEAA